MDSRLSTKAIGDLGRKISDATIFMHEAISRKMGLNGTDHKYLNIVIDKGKITAGELSALTGLTTGAVTGVIDRLEKKKFVKRESDKADRRKIFIVPNYEKVNKILSTSHLDLKVQIEKLMSGYTSKELETIEKYLNATVVIMNDITNRLNAK